MLEAFYFAAGLLAFLPYTHAAICGGNFCLNDDTQDAYCCGYNDRRCCYVTRVVRLWWFWLLLVFSLVFFCVCMLACCRHRRRSRVGYVVVRGETHAPRTIVTTQVAATSTQHNGIHQAYQGYATAPKTHAYPPPYSQHPPHAPYG